MPDILSLLSIAFLPLLITIILVWGIWKKVPIYDTFIKGAKDGLKTSVEILPFLLGIFLAIGALTSSGAMGFLQETTRPFFEKIGIPQELISLILLRPVSGSGSLVLAQQIMEVTGPDSFAGRAASVMVGSCETVFYVLALYFGVTSVKKCAMHSCRGSPATSPESWRQYTCVISCDPLSPRTRSVHKFSGSPGCSFLCRRIRPAAGDISVLCRLPVHSGSGRYWVPALLPAPQTGSS